MMSADYDGPAVLRPDLIREENAKRARELVDALKMALAAIDALIETRPIFAAKICGTTTLGNVRAEIKAVLYGR